MYLKAFILMFAGLAVLASPMDKRAVPQATYDNLDMFMKYAGSAYSPQCPRPLGNTLVATFDNPVTSTQGYLARDDNNRLLVVALRGSQQFQDFLTDALVFLVPYFSPGVSAPFGSLVHSGFLIAYNSIASDVISAVRSQLAGPAAGYQLRTTGHSLGGALSSLAAVSLKSNFPNTPIQMYTYGQPRTGNFVYANFVNSLFDLDAFRNVHTSDGVPTILPQFVGYRHHAYEYWQTPDPSSRNTVRRCDASGEDPTCSNTIFSTGINAAHNLYFGRPVNASFCN